jgi:outer membrane protein assembly factor BamB
MVHRVTSQTLLACGVAVCGLAVASLAAAPVTAAPVAVAPHVAAGVWAQDGYGPGNTGVNPSETTITAANVAALAYRWSIVSPLAHDACGHQNPPVLGGGRLFLTDQGGLAAYDATTGHQLWTKRFVDPADESAPVLAVAGGTLLVATDDCQSQSDPDGDLTAYDVATGAVRWHVHRDAPMYTGVVDGNVIVVAGGDAGQDQVSGYRVGDGKHLWDRADVRMAAGVSAGGRVLLSRIDNGTIAVRMSDGGRVWSTSTEWSAVAATPNGHRFLVTNAGGDLVEVYGGSGDVAWTAKGRAGQVAVDANHVTVANGTELIGLDAKGRQKWADEAFSAVRRPVVADGVVYAAVSDGSVLVVGENDGTTLDLDPLYGNVVGHVVVTGGRLYATDGRILDVFTP